MKECFFQYATETVVMHNFVDAFEGGCDRCTLSNCNKPILMRGNPEAPIMLIGEAPGKVEEEERTPFIGPAGQLLEKIISSIDLDIDHDLLLTNAVYCRPAAPEGSGKQNYTPKKEQVELCKPFTESLIRIVKPRAIIACGRTALIQLTGKENIRMSDMEGKWDYYVEPFRRNGDPLKIPMFTMTHPAALLYLKGEEQTKKKNEVWEYIKKFRDTWKDKKICIEQKNYQEKN